MISFQINGKCSNILHSYRNQHIMERFNKIRTLKYRNITFISSMQLKNSYFKCFPECLIKRDLCIFYMIYNVKRMINGTQVTCHQCLVKIWILWGFSCHKEAHTLNTLRLRQNRHHFADDIVKCIFFNENVWFPNKFSHKIQTFAFKKMQLKILSA